MKYARILGTGSFLPEKTLTNAELEKMVDTSDQWIMERTGIKCRHVLENHETTVTMAEIAAKRALEASQIDKNKIGMVIVATVTPDTLFPNVASRIQNKLGLNVNQCPSFDISAACAGFIYALSIANQYIKAGAIDYALVVSTDALTKFTDWTDRSTCVLFGDGAGAVVLGASDEPGIYSTHLHTDGRFSNLVYLSGSVYNNEEPRYIKMRGNELFKVAVKKLSELIDEALAYNNVTKEEIDWLIPHQANIRIINATAKRLGIPREKVMITIEDQGNTSSASIPLALDIGVKDGRIKHGDIILFDAIGSGLMWGSALVKY